MITAGMCPACKGLKKIMGLGQIQRDCLECGGVGFIKSKNKEWASEENMAEEISDGYAEVLHENKISVKKRGRPKGWKKS